MDKRLLTVLPTEYHHRLGDLDSVMAVQRELECLSLKLESALSFAFTAPEKAVLDASRRELWLQRQHLNVYARHLLRCRFVSEYATTSPDEDMAETFAEFVFTDRPTGTLLKDKKVLSYYADKDLVAVRNTLRSNLTRLGL